MTETTAPPRRCWYQFRLRTLLIVMAVVALPLAWVAKERRQSSKELHAVERLEQLGFQVQLGGPFELVDFEFVEPAPQGFWRDMARHILGERILFVWVTANVSDLTPLAGLTNVRSLYAGHNSTLTNIDSVGTLTTLERIYLQHSPVADIASLARLPHLELIYIGDTNVRDLTSLHHLSKLKELDISNLRVSEGEIASLKKALPNCSIMRGEASPKFETR